MESRYAEGYQDVQAADASSDEKSVLFNGAVASSGRQEPSRCPLQSIAASSVTIQSIRTSFSLDGMLFIC